jgi:protein-disulfide isomerase
MISGVRLRTPVSRDDHTRGPEGAPLVLLEYGDYECPFCGRAYLVVKRLEAAFKNDLRFAFRNYPLPHKHPNAENAARAAEAAAQQGKFWEMYDLLFENQDNLTMEFLEEYAAALDLDLDRFAADMRSPRSEQKINSDRERGDRSGVDGTPTFYINGIRYDGDWSYDSLHLLLQEIRDEVRAKGRAA